MDTEPEAQPERTQPEVKGVEAFAARCAHDLNNLLTGILGNLELMRSRARRSGVTQFDGYLEGARNAADRAAMFARRLLMFSGQATDLPTLVPVNGLLRDIAETLRAQSVPVELELDPATGGAFCDSAQLEQALNELLANAQDAVAAGGTIKLRSQAAGETVIVTVLDSGCGMTPGVLARAQEPFFSTRPGGAGKGLGLPIASYFARCAGGTLTLTSTPTQGTTATLTLPCPKQD